MITNTRATLAAYVLLWTAYVITSFYAHCLTVWVGKSWLKGKAKALELKINAETMKCLQSEAVHHQQRCSVSLSHLSPSKLLEVFLFSLNFSVSVSSLVSNERGSSHTLVASWMPLCLICITLQQDHIFTFWRPRDSSVKCDQFMLQKLTDQ